MRSLQLARKLAERFLEEQTGDYLTKLVQDPIEASQRNTTLL